MRHGGGRNERRAQTQEVQTWIESGQQTETCGHVLKTLQAGVGLEALARTPGALVAHIVVSKAAIQVVGGLRTHTEKEVAQEAPVDETSTHAPSQHGKREASGDAWEEGRRVSPLTPATRDACHTGEENTTRNQTINRMGGGWGTTAQTESGGTGGG